MFGAMAGLRGGGAEKNEPYLTSRHQEVMGSLDGPVTQEQRAGVTWWDTGSQRKNATSFGSRACAPATLEGVLS